MLFFFTLLSGLFLYGLVKDQENDYEDELLSGADPLNEVSHEVQS